MAGKEFDLYSVLESLPDGVYLTDRAGSTLFVSRSYERITGLARGDLIGKNVKDLEKLGVFAPVTNPLIVETGKPVTCPQTNKTGRRLMVSGYPVRSPSGSEILGVVTVVRDIPGLDQLKHEIEHQRILLEKYGEEAGKSLDQSRPIFTSEKMRTIMDLTVRLANVDTTVMISGETGVGKELIAKTLHVAGPRRSNPYFTVNCAAMPDNLIDSELFGYDPGAFTGAHAKGKPGLFELANEGTLFLDEIGELAVSVQAKLLRAIQAKEIMRIGGKSVMKVNTRVVAATNRDLHEMVLAGTFRKDLFYRLTVAAIEIPPLRERPEDILPLAELFLGRYNTKHRRNVSFTSSALEALRCYRWPGNIRELENIVESLVVAHPGSIVDVPDLPRSVSKNAGGGPDGGTPEDPEPPGGSSLRDLRDLAEKRILARCMELHGRNVYAVAERLGCDRTTIQRKLRKYGIQSGP